MDIPIADQLVLERLYATTPLTVEELIYTPDMERIHQEFRRVTLYAIPIGDLYKLLVSLKARGRLEGKQRCLRCDRLRPKVTAYLCPECFDEIRGIKRPPWLPKPPGMVGTSNGGGPLPARHWGEASPWQQVAIRRMEESLDVSDDLGYR